MPIKCMENSFLNLHLNFLFTLLILVTIILLFIYLKDIHTSFAQTPTDMYNEGYLDGCHDAMLSFADPINRSFVHISNSSNLSYSYNKGYDNGLSDECSINILSQYLETKNHEKFYNADGESMSPTIHAKDLIFIDNNSSNFDHLKNGDIIIFKATDPSLHNDTIIHRIIHIFRKGDTIAGNSTFNNLCEPMMMPKVAPVKIIMTKGDANNCSIPLADVPVKKQNYVGKVKSINGRKIN